VSDSLVSTRRREGEEEEKEGGEEEGVWNTEREGVQGAEKCNIRSPLLERCLVG
jgi:hypothetical protein